MAIKGQKLKEGVIQAILQAFPENTFYDENKKEVRFEGTEDGNRIQIKISFTCAKDIIERDNKILLENNKETNDEITKEEKENIEDLLHSIGY